MNIKAAAGLLPAWQLINAARASIYFPFRRQLFAFRAAAERESARPARPTHFQLLRIYLCAHGGRRGFGLTSQ
jgi:hypothetical protein